MPDFESVVWTDVARPFLQELAAVDAMTLIAALITLCGFSTDLACAFTAYLLLNYTTNHNHNEAEAEDEDEHN